MDNCKIVTRSGIQVSVMLNGEYDEDGNMITTHEMMIAFRKRFTRGFNPIGSCFCPVAIRERIYRIAPENWDKVNAKYCGNRLTIV